MSPLGIEPSPYDTVVSVANHCTGLATFNWLFIQIESFDEANFWLNGYVNKQNCRIWSESNPQVYVETPLHPEKLTVWCALWAGGILLQKR
ncbi:putative transposable element [Trichonephila clavipes]|uniref:Putative transposable element n=1 Tax=Trichonephila clavipes TaxID=2585209 RepID=A0A8X6W2J2_TRICX|nr:putative transposable element [Trichonephila clavipes]